MKQISKQISKMNAQQIVTELKRQSNPKAREGMARYGIKVEKAFGVSIPTLRAIAKKTGRNQQLSLEIWNTGYHEARILAAMVGEPEKMTDALMEKWVHAFNSWDVCDQVILNLFRYTPFAWQKAVQWSLREEEFVKRAGYAMMAQLAVSDKKASDAMFVGLFPHIKRGAKDPRNMVKKAVNWALRQIGKRNLTLHKNAIVVGEKILKMPYPGAKWIAMDALRELRNPRQKQRLREKA
ncbi:MAG: DNA alkylation repair protein [Nanoarchaeota archaeon]